MIDYIQLEREAKERGDPVPFLRTSGEMICSTCKQPYWRHKHSDHIDFDGNRWLRRLCSGQLVKL